MKLSDDTLYPKTRPVSRERPTEESMPGGKMRVAGAMERGQAVTKFMADIVVVNSCESLDALSCGHAEGVACRLANPTLGSGLHSKITPLLLRRLSQASRLRQ
jgi:hypothetical protein